MKLTMDAGIKAKPMETTNTMKIPLACYYLCLNFRVTGKPSVTTLKLKLGLLVAVLRMDSYMNCG